MWLLINLENMVKCCDASTDVSRHGFDLLMRISSSLKVDGEVPLACICYFKMVKESHFQYSISSVEPTEKLSIIIVRRILSIN